MKSVKASQTWKRWPSGEKTVMARSYLADILKKLTKSELQKSDEIGQMN